MKFSDFIINVLRALKFPIEELSPDTSSRMKKILFQKDTTDVLLRKRLYDLAYATVEFMLENAREHSLFQETLSDARNDTESSNSTLLNSAENEELLNTVNVTMFLNGTITMVFDFLNNTEEIVQCPGHKINAENRRNEKKEKEEQEKKQEKSSDKSYNYNAKYKNKYSNYKKSGFHCNNNKSSNDDNKDKNKDNDEDQLVSNYSRDSVENVIWGLFASSQSFLGTLESSNLEDFSLIRAWRSKITFDILYFLRENNFPQDVLMRVNYKKRVKTRVTASDVKLSQLELEYQRLFSRKMKIYSVCAERYGTSPTFEIERQGLRVGPSRRFRGRCYHVNNELIFEYNNYNYVETLRKMVEFYERYIHLLC